MPLVNTGVLRLPPPALGSVKHRPRAPISPAVKGREVQHTHDPALPLLHLSAQEKLLQVTWLTAKLAPTPR